MPRKARHASQLSISDENHHVTEAIGNIYGDTDYTRRGSKFETYRPSADVVPPSSPDSLPSQLSRAMAGGVQSSRTRAGSNGISTAKVHPSKPAERSPSPAGGESTHGRSCSLALPPFAESSVRETANAQFPLTTVDYESNPDAVAQEIVNLQALRRMSMVDNATNDPDLPSYTATHMPTVAPTSAHDDDDDTSRLFWVPARLHPELAPKEFKTFLEKRIGEIKRTSGDGSLLPNASQRQGSGGGLRRKKSMLSRQIDNKGGRGGEGYEDGAERLERKRSRSGHVKPGLKVADLQELDAFAHDPAKLIRKLSLELDRTASERGGQGPADDEEDMPILPAAPPGQSLRRSTRTTYRRGSQRKADRMPLSNRATKAVETDSEDSSTSSLMAHGEDLPVPGLARVQTEPLLPQTGDHVANFSMPSGLDRAAAAAVGSVLLPARKGLARRGSDKSPSNAHEASTSSAQRAGVDRTVSSGHRPGRSDVMNNQSVPMIIETPPSERDDHPTSLLAVAPPAHLPERKSSYKPPPALAVQGGLPHGAGAAARAPTSAGLVRHAHNANRPTNQTLNDIVGQPSPLPGNSTRTDSLSFIPTFADERKLDKKAKEKREKDVGEGGPARKSSWGWLLGGEEKKEEGVKKTKAKANKAPDGPIDSARLDLLQTSIDSTRGRKSLVVDRGDIRLEEERKKESYRKTTESKKEKETGLFSSFFGGGRKKGEREVGKTGRGGRDLSPEPPLRILRPDIDYHWTRFPLADERAIYRMAHIKLANPRRPLYCQVLLSNFMYSYLAKVQQMHPAIPAVQTLIQKQQQRQQQQQQQQQQQAQPPSPSDTPSGTSQDHAQYSSPSSHVSLFCGGASIHTTT